jgi:hypothetical protein
MAIGRGRVQQCVAVRRRLRDEVVGDARAGAGFVFHDDALPQPTPEEVAEHARQDVVGPTGAIG